MTKQDEARRLKPCPFCGGEAHFNRLGTPRQSCVIECSNCGAWHESSDEGDRCGSSWNKRAAQPEARQLVPSVLGGIASPAQPEAPPGNDDCDDCEATRERMSDILTRSVNALRGEPPALTMWSWHDLPDRITAAMNALRGAMELAAQPEAQPAVAASDEQSMLNVCPHYGPSPARNEWISGWLAARRAEAAQPGQERSIDERRAFEAWLHEESPSPAHHRMNGYCAADVERAEQDAAWDAWQARAVLAADRPAREPLSQAQHDEIQDALPKMHEPETITCCITGSTLRAIYDAARGIGADRSAG